ncbi:MAG: retention module-containing protein, partial [Gammaproteobacteria bacterium]|nr:retention module-containing protein [Gammaproteobacteria bacterium]
MANAHIGRVETIDGGVTVTPLSGIESPLTQGMPVYMNDLIKTDADASVRIRLHDGSSLLIDGGQTISLDENFVDVSGTGILIAEGSIAAVTVTGITTVSSVEGKVQVVRGGIPRDLVAGDLLYPGDTLIAAADGSAILQLSDGSETVIEPGSQSRLGGSNIAQQEGEFLTSGIDDPAEIQAAILAGRDPSQDAPAPGVGETESNEGHTHIRILPSGRAVTPDSGHETHGQDLPVSFYIEELLQDQDSIPDLNVTYISGFPGTVDEAGLTNGSRSNDGSATTSGSFTIDTGNDQLATFEVQDQAGNWIDVTAGNVLVQGVNGVLTVTLNNGVYNWSYDLTTNLTTHTDTDLQDGDSDRGAADQVPGDLFPVRIIDNDGDISPPASIDIVVNDDGPQAVDDNVGTAEDTAITYNVLGNDTAGADGPATLTAASLASGQGTVTYLANGDITVTPAAGYEGPIEVNYTIVDGDGDSSSAKLTVMVDPDSVPVLNVQDGTVDEAALPGGSNDASPNEATSGGFGINTGGDGVGSLVINGVDVTGGGITVPGVYG